MSKKVRLVFAFVVVTLASLGASQRASAAGHCTVYTAMTESGAPLLCIVCDNSPVAQCTNAN